MTSDRKSVLRSLFGTNPVALPCFLLENGFAVPVIYPDDTKVFRNWLMNLYVLLPPYSPRFPADISIDVRSSQSEIVTRVISFLLRNRSYRHTLTQGYRKSMNGDINRGGIENFAPNTVVSYLKSHCWSRLLERIGDGIMQFLLQYCLVFELLDNNCFLQLTGVMITDFVKYERPGLIVADRQRKPSPLQILKQVTHHEQVNILPDTTCNNNDEMDIDISMVESVAISNVSTAQEDSIAVHCTQTNNNLPMTQEKKSYSITLPSQSRSPKTMISRFSMFYARSSQNMVPGRVLAGLSSSHPLNRPPSGSKDMSMVKLIFPTFFALAKPKDKRLQKLKLLTDKLRVFHARCRYDRSLTRFCSFNIETGSQNLLQSHSSYYNVFSYIRWCLQSVIPKDFWGHQDNLLAILSHLDRFIKLRRFETVSIDELCRGFKTTPCDWLNNSKTGQCGPQDHALKSVLVRDFIYWLFNDFIMPLLKSSFYITETTPYRHRIFYFRHDIWHMATNQTTSKLTIKTFEQLSQSDLLRLLTQKDFGFFKMRFLPKENGLRPIVNLNKRFVIQHGKTKMFHGASQQLKGPFAVLSSLKDQNEREMLGSAVLGVKEIYERLKEFKQKYHQMRYQPTGHLPKLYFVKFDVVKAFDTISQDKLCQLIENLVTSEEYMSFCYASVYVGDGRTKKRVLRQVVSTENFPFFLDVAGEAAKEMRNAILIDQVNYSYQKRETLIEVIKKHLKQNYVEIGKRLYQQVEGIPQGSVLSSLLCSLFYGDMEKNRINAHQHDYGSLLLRFLDDFLFITIHQDKAISLAKSMYIGYPDYGCFVNKEKTLANFELNMEGRPVNRLPDNVWEFPWCGVLINTKTLDVTSDISRYYGSYIADSITVDGGIAAGEKAIHKIIFFLKPKCHALYLNTCFNSRRTVLINIYEIFLIAAMKFCVYIRDMPFKHHNSSSFFLRVIDSVLVAAYGLFKSRSFEKSENNGDSFNVLSTESTWLGLHAFQYVLRRRPSQFCVVLDRLKSTMLSLEIHKDPVKDLSLRKVLNSVSKQVASKDHLTRILY